MIFEKSDIDMCEWFAAVLLKKEAAYVGIVASLTSVDSKVPPSASPNFLHLTRYYTPCRIHPDGFV